MCAQALTGLPGPLRQQARARGQPAASPRPVAVVGNRLPLRPVILGPGPGAAQRVQHRRHRPRVAHSAVRSPCRTPAPPIVGGQPSPSRSANSRPGSLNPGDPRGARDVHLRETGPARSLRPRPPAKAASSCSIAPRPRVLVAGAWPVHRQIKPPGPTPGDLPRRASAATHPRIGRRRVSLAQEAGARPAGDRG